MRVTNVEFSVRTVTFTNIGGLGTKRNKHSYKLYGKLIRKLFDWL